MAVFKLQRKLSEVSPELKFTPICMESKRESNKCLEFPGFLCEIKDQHCKLDGSNVRKFYIYALSFYKSKMILDRLNHFGRVQFVLDGSRSLDLLNLIRHVQNDLDLYFGSVQNKFEPLKRICTHQQRFGRTKIILPLIHLHIFDALLT